MDNLNLGIRVNVNPVVFNENDIGYIEDGFRFGFSEENGELLKALKLINVDNCNLGLHFHCNSITRNLSVYKSIAEYAKQIIKKYGLNISYIDIGGGFFGGVEGKPTPEQYVSVIKECLEDVVDTNKVKLIIEPGSEIIGSAVDLHTSVLDVKDTLNARIVTTDGRRIFIDPLWKKSNYLYSIETDNHKGTLNKQIVCGYTCMDHDRIMCLNDVEELSVDDKIIYHRVGAYTMTFGGMFIRYYPEVYAKSESGLQKVRSQIEARDYYNIHS